MGYKKFLFFLILFLSLGYSAGANTIDMSIVTGNDDAEERNSNGAMYLDSSDLELIQDGSKMQSVGLRFGNLTIPQGATIGSAYIQFRTDETSSGATTLTIHGEKVANALSFTSARNNISSRVKTTALATWTPQAWTTKNEQGDAQKTTDLTAIVQELVNQGSWSSGNAMAFIITGSGKRVADSYEGKAPAILHIEYGTVTPPIVDTEAPVVMPNGDANLTIFVGGTYTELNATVSDNMDENLTAIITGTVDTNTVGVYTITYTATDSAGNEGTATRTIHVVEAPTGVMQVESFVATGNDDAEERNSNGAMYLDSSDLELIQDGNKMQSVGLRFGNLTIPQGATIGSAYIQFRTDETSSGATTLTIHGEKVANALSFTSARNNISSRVKTTALATWTPQAWTTKNEQGDAQKTTDLTAIVQELVNQGSWSSGNAMAFIITGSGKRVADSYEGKAPAILHIEYGTVTPPIVDTEAPVVVPNGDANLTIFVGGTYSEPNATVSDNMDENLTAIITGTVDTNTVGVYTITYTATDSAGNEGTATRTIHVVEAPIVDTEAPVVTPNGDTNLTIFVGGTYTELNATVSDNIDENLTAVITGVVNTNAVGVYTITYTATDSAGNVGTATRTIHVVEAPIVDTEAPVVVPNGDANLTIFVGGTYTELNATVSDNIDENLTAMITGVVNTNAVGVYTITYTATDSAGNVGTATRTVNVIEAPAVDNNATVNGRIVSTQGSVIPNVAVRVFKENNATALNLNISSDNNGLFTIELNEDSNFTLQFMAEGYATQVLPIHTPNIGGSLSLDIVMIPRGVAQAVSGTNTSTVMGNDGATVTVDAGVFVDSNGDVVTDNIVVTITPVDVSTPLGVATFPGNFAGIQEGETTPTPIVSYGVVEYQFTRNGEVLQLAQGETAQIEIPIYVTTHQNGTAIALGDVIPLWSLDEATGIWTQDGTGTVVASASSPTGFALRATVNHFTWWNCDVSMNAARAIITVTAPQAGTAVIKARTDAYIGWRPDTVSTVIDVNESTYPLYIPSNAEVCFWAEITFNNGTTVTTQEVCRTATPSSTINVNLGLVSADLALAVTPYETITTEINQAAVQLIVLPTTYESSVTYSIVSGSLPTGVTLSSISATRAVIAGVPTQEGTFDVVIQGVDSDGTMATVDITYSVVADNTPPEITLLGNQYVSIDVNTPYVDAGATASDNVDGDITARIVKTIIYYDWSSEQSAIAVSEVNSSVAGTYQIDYDVNDTHGNRAETVRRYVDVIGCNVPPYLYLNGDDNVTLFVGASYTEFGATAYDCMERLLDVNITGDVNTSTVGTYTVTYTATDASGHVVTVVRNIHVVPIPDGVPDAFMFTDLTNVNLYEWQQGSVNINGINAPTAVSIVNGEYSLDGGINWVSSDGNVTNGSTILVRHLSANAYVTSVDTNLTVGGITDTFTSTTKVFVDQPPVALIEYNETQQNKTVYVGGNLYVNTGGEDDVGIEYCKWEDNNHDVIVEATVDPAEQYLYGKCELYNAPIPTVAGNYIYTLTVRDTNGAIDTNELNITVLANSIPTVDIGGDRNITEGTTLNIIATASDDDGDDVTYQWSYGLKDSGVMMGAGSTLEFSHQFNTTGLYVVEFRVMDSHGASVTKQIDVNVSANVADTTPPVITLVGDAVVEVIEGGTYTESGATAIDDTDGDISADIVVDSSTVDTTVVGSYTVTYNVQDNAGNDAVEVTRTVNVVVAPMPTLKIKAVDIGLNPVTIDKFGYTFELMTDAVAPITTGTDIVSFYGFIEGYSNPATDYIVLAVDNRYADGSQFQVRVKDSSGNIVGQSDIFIKSGNGAVNFGTIAITVVEPTIEAQIVERHNVYRNLEFSDSNLTWDATLATHAQQWADYLATHYTAENRTAGVSPHANSFDVTTHGLSYLNEGENIAWTSNNQGYILDEPVDITIADLVRDNFLATGKSGAVDIWANEKAYYDYDTNSGDGHVVGHYTQIVWKNTTHVGCGKAVSMTNNGGTHVVCRYSPAGNYIGQKPY